VVDVDPCAVADTEAMNRVVLDVDIVDRARSEDFAKLDEVVRSAWLASRLTST
jgi:hypothetical protein